MGKTEVLTKIEIPGLYKDDKGTLFLVDDFGFACKLELAVANLLTQRCINALAALAGHSF